MVRVFARGVYLRGELRLWRRDGRERFGQRCGPAPRKKEKQVISGVPSCPCGSPCTPERGKASYSSGSTPRLSRVGRTSPTRTSRARTIAHFPPFVLYLLKKERGDTMSEPNIQIREAADCMQHWRKNCGEWTSKIWKRVSECRRPGMNI